MNILFVSSGNSKKFKISPFILSQGESLSKLGLDVDYYLINGSGVLGYLKNIFSLRYYIKKNKFDIVHSHYGLSALTTVLTFTKIPHVFSVMGSDINGDYNDDGSFKKKYYFIIFLTKIFLHFADHIIVKSEKIKQKINKRSNVSIIPNGVDINAFKPVDKNAVREKLLLKKDSKILLFLGNPENSLKNFALLEKANEILNDPNIILLSPYPVKHEFVPLYLNAADVLVLTSRSEGSPNVIKEAMACNTPIVATDVGDVRWVMDNTEGCNITSFDVKDVANKLKSALKFAQTKGETDGRKKILELGLDSETVANKIIEIYNKVLDERK